MRERPLRQFQFFSPRHFVAKGWGEVCFSPLPEAGAIPDFTSAFGAPTPLANGHLRLHLYIDDSSVETFAQDGLITLSAQTFGSSQADGVALFADQGDAKLVHLEIYSLASVWSQNETVPSGIECS